MAAEPLISEHLTVAEFIATNVTRLRATQQQEWTASPAVQHAARRFAVALFEPLRFVLNRPLTVTSGYRCPALNAAVGGKPGSHHLFGLAADVIPNGMPLLTAMAALARSRHLLPDLDVAIFEFGRWMHVQLALPETKPRGACLMTFDGTAYFAFNERDAREMARGLA